ncbi:MAG: hypothetical protein K0M69_11345 [Youngiibacter sp.]|nr:hypothetical protein [Youngiibacter sp.]
MSERRDLSLSYRESDTREKRSVHVASIELSAILKHFDENMLAIESQFAIADTLVVHNVEAAKEIWRSQIVFIESAFDFFLHEITKYGMLKIFNGEWAKTAKYNNFSIKLSEVTEAIKNPENASWLTNNINTSIASLTFMSSESFKDQMNLIGVPFAKIADSAFAERGSSISPQVKLKTILDELYKRRNKIAHQSDREHISSNRLDIEKEFVVESIGNIKVIVISLLQQISEKDSKE